MAEEQPQQAAEEQQPRRRAPRPRRTAAATAAEDTIETTETSGTETPAGSEPGASIEEAPGDASEQATAGRRTRGRRGSGSTARRGAASAAPPEEAAAEPADEPVADAAPIIEPDPERGPPPPPTMPQRTRGSRGGRGRGGRDRDEAPRGFRDDGPPQRSGRDDFRRDDRPQREERPPDGRQLSTPAPPPRRQDGPPGSVESLIARQNVLFEEFANNQSQTLREVQRALSTGSRGGPGNAASSFALPKVGIFLDVPNLIYTAEQLGVRIHFGKLLDYLTEGRQLVRATAYAPITDDPMTRFEAQRFVAPIIGHGYKIVSKAWKRFADGSMKANFDIELAVDILTMSDRLDIVVLMSGDGDFRRVVELVESKGVRVEVVAFAASTAMELRAVADSYTDVGQILNIVSV